MREEKKKHNGLGFFFSFMDPCVFKTYSSLESHSGLVHICQQARRDGSKHNGMKKKKGRDKEEREKEKKLKLNSVNEKFFKATSAQQNPTLRAPFLFSNAAHGNTLILMFDWLGL
jgi:hypothetical protein